MPDLTILARRRSGQLNNLSVHVSIEEKKLGDEPIIRIIIASTSVCYTVS